MNITHKVSFDFDFTLSEVNVQRYAKELILRGFEVHITTSRLSPDKAQPKWNDDLFEVAKELGIPSERITFLNYEDKEAYFCKNPKFLWHLDDTEETVKQINLVSEVKAFNVERKGWKKECENILKTCL